MGNGWDPAGTHYLRQPPAPGRLFAQAHAVWRVVHVVDLPLTDADREVWLQAGMPDPAVWKGRPIRLDVEWMGGARPEWAPADGPVPPATVTVPAEAFSSVTWDVYPASGRWPMCSCCGEPMPCRAELQDREVQASLDRIETLAQRLPGCCWACGEPTSSRQKTVVYPGDNLDLPGGPEVRFHTRQKCWGSATGYEQRWIAEDPRRDRILTYPQCGGILVVHADGSSECRDGQAPLTGFEKKREPDCGGHLTHDHGVHTACYVGDSWRKSRYDASECPRGCPVDGHPGTRTTPRPERRDVGGHQGVVDRG